MNKYLTIFILFFVSISISSLSYIELPDDELTSLAEDGDTEAQYMLAQLLESLKYSDNEFRFSNIDKDPFKWYQDAASSGHAKSLTRVGKEYFSKFGYFKEQDFTKAHNFLKQASDNDSEAALLLSLLYFKGLGVTQDKQEADRFLKKSQEKYFRLPVFISLEKEFVEMIRELAKNKDQNALHILGDFYYFGETSYYPQDYKKAYRIYKQGADLESSNASYMVGLMHYEGKGVLKDLRESFKWITASAEGGCIPAQIKAGIMNYFGEGCEIDQYEAFRWFNKTAPTNDPLSQYFLGVMFFKGEGTDRDYDQSKKWIKLAFENGSTAAKKFWDDKELWNIP